MNSFCRADFLVKAFEDRGADNIANGRFCYDKALAYLPAQADRLNKLDFDLKSAVVASDNFKL